MWACLQRTQDGILRVASLLDLAGTKIKALLQRVEAKDYLDVAALLDAGVSLEQVLGAARALFGPSFNPLVAQNAGVLRRGRPPEPTGGGQGDAHGLRGIQDLEVSALPKVSERLDLRLLRRPAPE